MARLHETFFSHNKIGFGLEDDNAVVELLITATHLNCLPVFLNYLLSAVVIGICQRDKLSGEPFLFPNFSWLAWHVPG